MMAQKKLIRFEEIRSFPNVLEYPDNVKGKWKAFFKNDNPIGLELACGKGEYTIGLSQLYPGKNFIGVDIKGNRLWVGARSAIDKKLSNVAFLRTQIDGINSYFAKDEVEEIWITFPDPFLRGSKAKKRLTHPKFLRLYKQFLQPGGLIHLKTDSPDLYQFTKTVTAFYDCTIADDIPDVYKKENIKKELNIRTHYESLDISGSNTVFYLSFMLPETIKENDEALDSFLKQPSL